MLVQCKETLTCHHIYGNFAHLMLHNIPPLPLTDPISLFFIAPETIFVFCLFGSPNFRFGAYLIKVIPETRRAN